MAANGLPLINGKAYEFADITCIILGTPIIGVTAIEYGEEDATENIYATGRYPVARGYGQITPSAKVTILMNEVMNIVSAAPNGRIQDIPEFDIVVTFTDANLIPVVHKIRNCRFMKNMIASATGDTSIPMELDLVVSHIEFV
jgi:hypothetical protein